MPPLTARVREMIRELLFRQGTPVGADYTIVLGMTLWQNPLDAALRLVADGCAGRLVFTGGPNPQIGRPEGEVMAEAAIARGVPPDMVFCENRARHTGENLAFSWALMRALPEPARAVNLVGISYHMARALLTARTVIPADVALGYQGYASVHFGPENWHLSERGRRDVLGEVAKLGRYFPDAVPKELRGLQNEH
jgi:uncharacterized SAM-binding protein YcdF (DUF218 family)